MNDSQDVAIHREAPKDRMRVLDYHKIADFTYEVTTESARRGRVTRRVLVLPGAAIGNFTTRAKCEGS